MPQLSNFISLSILELNFYMHFFSLRYRNIIHFIALIAAAEALFYKVFCTLLLLSFYRLKYSNQQFSLNNVKIFC
jgi:hypothetical protein